MVCFELIRLSPDVARWLLIAWVYLQCAYLTDTYMRHSNAGIDTSKIVWSLGCDVAIPVRTVTRTTSYTIEKNQTQREK